MGKLLKIGCGAVLIIGVLLAVVAAVAPKPAANTSGAIATSAPPTANVAATLSPNSQEGEQAYANAVARISGDMSQSLSQFSALMEDAKVGDVDWSVDTAMQFAIWHASYLDAQALTPPDAYQGMHTLFLDALRRYDEAGQEIAKGIDANDMDRVAVAAGAMVEAANVLGQANSEMQRVQGSGT